MSLKSLTLRVPATLADALSDALLEAGAQAVSVEDAHAGTDRERPVFGEPGASAPGLWEDNLVRALLPADLDADALVETARRHCGHAAPLAYTIEPVPDDDWVRRTQSQFQPVYVGPGDAAPAAAHKGLWIVPSWHEPVDPDAINIRLDPGLAFGTGTHPTTRLCLGWLLLHAAPGKSMLDYGCGSGILAIAAARLGASPVWGVDIDPDAVAAASVNAAHNGVEVRFVVADEAIEPVFDLVAANILANPLRLLAPALAARVRPGGRLALSGLLEAQGDELQAIYSPYFEMSRFAELDGWLCLEGTRR